MEDSEENSGSSVYKSKVRCALFCEGKLEGARGR